MLLAVGLPGLGAVVLAVLAVVSLAEAAPSGAALLLATAHLVPCFVVGSALAVVLLVVLAIPFFCYSYNGFKRMSYMI